MNLVLNVNPIITAAGLKVIGQRLQARGPAERTELRAMLTHYAAEAESLLHANTDPPSEQFLDQFMDANLKADAPAARLFREWAPNPFL